MKSLNLFICVAVLFAILREASGQEFVNLNFYEANLSAYGAGGSFVPATNAIPGWTGYLGSNQETSVLYNNLTIGEAAIAIIGTNDPDAAYFVIPCNNYTVVLQAGEVSSSIAQTALIPATAKTILFQASWPYASGWQVTVAGQSIPVSQLSTFGSDFAVYAGDISAFAGQTDALEFTALAGSGPPVNLYLDAISFSTSAVPEPSSLSLFGICISFIWLWARPKIKSVVKN
jgi:hypothetical protein